MKIVLAPVLKTRKEMVLNVNRMVDTPKMNFLTAHGAMQILQNVEMPYK